MTSGNQNQQKWAEELFLHPFFAALKNKFYKNEMEVVQDIFAIPFIRKTAARFLKISEPNIVYNKQESDRMREMADQYIGDPAKLQMAVALYTRAIYTAPKKSKSLALAHANRATVLYELHEFEAAYDDCICALELNHPDTQSILLRQATIASKLQDSQKFKDSIKCLEAIDVVTNEFSIAGESLSGVGKEKCLETPTEKNIQILSNSERGRCMVADEAIEKDEMIMSGHADAFIISDRYRQEFFQGVRSEDCKFVCDNCTDHDIVPFPCYDCRSVFYCSRKCRKNHIHIHQFECNGYKEGFLGDDYVYQFAMRCLFAGFGQMLWILEKLPHNKLSPNALDLWPAIVKTFYDGHVFGLTTNFNHFQRKHTIVTEGLGAFLSCQYLAIKTNFFRETQAERWKFLQSENEWQIIVTALLLRCKCQAFSTTFSLPRIIAQRSFTAHSILATGLYKSIWLDTAGSAVYGELGLLNHSCEANSIVKFDKLKLSLFSRKAIAKGEEITCDYIYNSLSKMTDERKEHLWEVYGFICNCDRCENEEDLLYIKSHQIVCECGAKLVRNAKINICIHCGEQLRAEMYLRTLSKLTNSVDPFDKYQKINEIIIKLQEFVPKTSVGLWEIITKDILFKFSSTTDQQIFSDEHINGYMTNLATSYLEISEGSYTEELSRVIFVSILLDLLVIRKKNGFGLPFSNYGTDKIKKTFWILGERERKWFERVYGMYTV